MTVHKSMKVTHAQKLCQRQGKHMIHMTKVEADLWRGKVNKSLLEAAIEFYVAFFSRCKAALPDFFVSVHQASGTGLPTCLVTTAFAVFEVPQLSIG